MGLGVLRAGHGWLPSSITLNIFRCLASSFSPKLLDSPLQPSSSPFLLWFALYQAFSATSTQEHPVHPPLLTSLPLPLTYVRHPQASTVSVSKNPSNNKTEKLWAAGSADPILDPTESVSTQSRRGHWILLARSFWGHCSNVTAPFVTC